MNRSLATALAILCLLILGSSQVVRAAPASRASLASAIPGTLFVASNGPPSGHDFDISPHSIAWMFLGCWVNLPDEDGLAGGFSLLPLPTTGRLVFAVRDVDLTFVRRGVHFTGEGFYWPQEPGGRQRMILTLRAGDEPPITFDSGLTRVRHKLPRIAITMDSVDAECMSITLVLRAIPAAADSDPSLSP